MITIDLSKQKALDGDPKAIQQINFTANLSREGNTTVPSIVEEAKETILDFSQKIWNYCNLFWFNIISI